MMTTVCDAAFYSILSKINITSFFYFNCIYWDFLWYLERSGHGLNWMKSMEKMQYFTHVPTSNHIHIQSFLSVSSINFYDSFDISGNIEYWKQNYVQLEWFFSLKFRITICGDENIVPLWVLCIEVIYLALTLHVEFFISCVRLDSNKKMTTARQQCTRFIWNEADREWQLMNYYIIYLFICMEIPLSEVRTIVGVSLLSNLLFAFWK